MSLTSYRAAPPRVTSFLAIGQKSGDDLGNAKIMKSCSCLFLALNANGPLLAACFLAEAVLVLCFEKILVLFLPFADLAATYSPAS